MTCRHGIELTKKTDCRPCYLAEYRRMNGRLDLRTRKTRARRYESQAAMTFDEIGRALGLSEKNAELICRQALMKLRRKPQLQALFRQSLSMKEKSLNRYEQVATAGLRANP